MGRVILPAFVAVIGFAALSIPFLPGSEIARAVLLGVILSVWVARGRLWSGGNTARRQTADAIVSATTLAYIVTQLDPSVYGGGPEDAGHASSFFVFSSASLGGALVYSLGVIVRRSR